VTVRIIYAIFLLVFVAAVGVFAWQNQDAIPINYLNRSVQYPMAAVVGVAYVLGMLTGWTVVGFVKSSMRRVTDRDRS
jgi:uncharacterized membrane protein YciS (DUF1049 family)